ncbi:MAG: aminoglycoside phosphotransferase family protein [Bacteroidetes bacterium]|nr:MAG: aminoglycoside phosphotransferase family protein [Bacteroidota bacterium]
MSLAEDIFRTFSTEAAGNYRLRAYGSGHIHDTFLAESDSPGAPRYILQRINAHVFRDPELVSRNLARITPYIAAKVQALGIADPERRYLSLIPTREGQAWQTDPAGDYWRMFPFLEGTRSLDELSHPQQAREAARAFARYAQQLDGLPVAEIGATIPHFHDAARRIAALEKAVETADQQRLTLAATEVEQAQAWKTRISPLLHLLETGAIPRRLVHNDTKINNLLFDAHSDEALCVIDLDTVMPGTLLYDFGDLVRTCVSPAAEDETDLSRVQVRPDMYEALLEGYLSEAGDWMQAIEKEYLTEGAILMTGIMAVRFLTDFLMGDVYYKIHHPMHNLDRAKNQFCLLQLLLAAPDR